jgi:ATP-dependent DNA ligase
MPFLIDPPIEPMLAKPAPEIPLGPEWAYEPKWDGFRALVFRDGDEVLIQSRDLRPLDRYFPELAAPLRAIGGSAARFVLDGEIVIAGDAGLEFEALLLRIHPAASRVAMLAASTPASYVAFDLLAEGDDDLRERPYDHRRARLEELLSSPPASVRLTPSTSDPDRAAEWFSVFEGAGLDGVIAKPVSGEYVAGKRTMVKIKHARTADCVVAGFRWHKNGPGSLVGSLLLGLYDEEGVLHSVGVASSFSVVRQRELTDLLAPYREAALESHPWREWKELESEWAEQRMPGATSRWNRGKDLSWEPVRIELVAEVAYDHLQGRRFRHATHFVRWRPDRSPAECRYDQLEETAPALLSDLFGG